MVFTYIILAREVSLWLHFSFITSVEGASLSREDGTVLELTPDDGSVALVHRVGPHHGGMHRDPRKQLGVKLLSYTVLADLCAIFRVSY